jgi:hypothetical protein
MKYIIQVKTKNKVNYLENKPTFKGNYLVVEKYWLFEEFKENATKFENIKEATKTIGELIADWSWATYTILEEKTYYPVKEISISDYN